MSTQRPIRGVLACVAIASPMVVCLSFREEFSALCGGGLCPCQIDFLGWGLMMVALGVYLNWPGKTEPESVKART